MALIRVKPVHSEGFVDRAAGAPLETSRARDATIDKVAGVHFVGAGLLGVVDVDSREPGGRSGHTAGVMYLPTANERSSFPAFCAALGLVYSEKIDSTKQTELLRSTSVKALWDDWQSGWPVHFPADEFIPSAALARPAPAHQGAPSWLLPGLKPPGP